MAESKVLNVAFIGCGGYNSGLAETALKSPKLRPVACFDISKEQSASFAEKYGMESCETIEELVSRNDVDGVIIASPNNAHRGNAEAAAAAGKHVFVDKPIANTVEDALAMIAATERAGVTLAIGHQGRRMPAHRKMKEMIEAGAIGTPVTVEANFSHSGGLGLKPEHWRSHRSECPALPLMQLGVHFADTVQYLLGNVVEVSSFMSHVATPADNEDVTVSLLKFDKGLLGYLGSNYATPAVYYVNVYGTEGNLYCEWGAGLVYRSAKAKENENVPLEGTDPQLEELEEYADCALTGKKFEVDGEAALRALAIVEAALKSNETGRPVKIDDLIKR